MARFRKQPWLSVAAICALLVAAAVATYAFLPAESSVSWKPVEIDPLSSRLRIAYPSHPGCDRYLGDRIDVNETDQIVEITVQRRFRRSLAPLAALLTGEPVPCAPVGSVELTGTIHLEEPLADRQLIDPADTDNSAKA